MTTQFCTNCGEASAPQAKFCKACGAQLSSKKSRSKKDSKSLLVLVIGIALILTAVLSFTTLTAVKNPAAVNNDVPFPEVGRATVDQVKADLDAGNAVIVDVRSADAYQEAHITGAILMPYEEVEFRYQELPKDKIIYLYCT